eukprot:394841_1
MKTNLHLYIAQYMFCINIQQLSLKHLENVWKYLDKLYWIEKGTWNEIPTRTMRMYRTEIEETLKASLKQFVYQHEMDKLWIFLSAFRRFLEDICSGEISNGAQNLSLSEFLQHADDIDEELIYSFPHDI